MTHLGSILCSDCYTQFADRVENPWLYNTDCIKETCINCPKKIECIKLITGTKSIDGIVDDYWVHESLWVTPEDGGLFVEIHVKVPEFDTENLTINYIIDWTGNLWFERFGTW